MMPSTLAIEERLSCKTVVLRASEAAGGHKVLAACSRLILKGATAAHARISEYGNAGFELERYMPVDIAIECDRRLMGFGLPPMIIANAARLLGLRLIARAPEPTGAAIRAEFCEFARESGEALAAAGMVADDATATALQLDRAIREVDEAVNAGLEMRELLAARRAQVSAEERR